MTEIKNKSKLDLEVFAINEAGAYIKHEHTYSTIIHTDEDDFFIPLTITVDVVRDYNINTGDVIIIDVSLPLGDFVKYIYPKRDNLEVTLVNTTVGSKTKERFKLILQNVDSDIKRDIYSKNTLKELNKNGMTRITGQCINKTLNELRTKTTHGVYKQKTVNDVINVVTMEFLKSFNLFGGILSRNLKMVPPDNTRSYDHIIIPDGTPVLDVPSFLQHGDYGVYNGGIGNYLQTSGEEEIMYIYPLYRTSDTIISDEMLHVIASENASQVTMSNTYAKEGNNLKIIATINTSVQDDGETDVYNKGVGFNAVDSDSVMNRPIEASKDGVTTDKKNIKRKQIHREPEDKNFKTPYIGIVNNFYAERSKVLRNDGSLIQIQWNFSNARLLKPGMQVKVFKDSGKDDIEISNGILQGVHIVTDNNKKMEVSMLNIFLENKNKKEN